MRLIFVNRLNLEFGEMIVTDMMMLSISCDLSHVFSLQI